MSNYCGGIAQQYDVYGGKCGVCGDSYGGPWDHEPGGPYATGIIGKTYQQGQIINVTIDITANHMGHFEFRLCENNEPMRKVKQKCFDRNLLLVYNNNEEILDELKYKAIDKHKFKYFVPHKANALFFVTLQLPEDITCTQCILQWRYHAGNNYGHSANNVECLGCAATQEEFQNCADIAIVPVEGNINLTNTSISNATNQTTINASSQSIYRLINRFNLFSFLFFVYFFYLNLN
jgi:hypothetical protein